MNYSEETLVSFACWAESLDDNANLKLRRVTPCKVDVKHDILD